MTDDNSKYLVLRKAAITMIGVSDDQGVLLDMIVQARNIGADAETLGLLIALYETGKP